MRTKEEILTFMKENHPDKTLIFLYQAGSHFFNLNTEESDLDFRGVYLPSPRTYDEQDNKLVKYNSEEFEANTSDDVDIDLYSLPFFFKLLKKADFNMMEALYTPDNKVLLELPLMKEIRSQRKNLLVPSISSFLGFFNSEYRQHTLNTDFHYTREAVYNFLKSLDTEENARLSDFEKEFEEFSKKRKDVEFKYVKVHKEESKQKVVEFSLHQFPIRVKIKYMLSQLEGHLSNASHRKKDRKAYKGLSHCLRLLYEAQQLLSEGEFHFPFTKERQSLLMKAKTGQIDDTYLRTLVEEELCKVKEFRSSFVKTNNSIHYIDKLDNILRARMNILKKMDI